MVFYVIPTFSIHIDDELQYNAGLTYTNYSVNSSCILWFEEKLYSDL